MSHEKLTHEPLVDEYLAWCKTNGYEAMSADELMYDISCKEVLTEKEEESVAWLNNFIERWDLAVQS